MIGNHGRWASGLILVLLASSTAFSQVKIQRTGDEVNIEVSISDLHLEKKEIMGQMFERPVLGGISHHRGIHFDPGTPELPVLRFFLMGSSEITVESGKSVDVIQGQFDAVPAQLSPPKIKGASTPFSFDQAYYQAQSPLPQKGYDIEKVGSYRGIDRYLLTLYPVRYLPFEKQYHLQRRWFVRQVGAREPVAQDTQRVAYVIGSRYADHPDLLSYIDAKKNAGMLTEMIIYGRDVRSIDGLRERLRQLLRERKSLHHVVIVGDHRDVPGYNADHIYGVTDHYYRCLDRSRYQNDIGSPDVGLGRLSVNDGDELSAVLEKLQRYQSREFNDLTWMSRASFVATSDHSWYDVAEKTHNHVIDEYMTSRGYQGEFPEHLPEGGDRLYYRSYGARGSHLMEALQAGRQIVNYSGHGQEDYWEAPELDQGDVRSLAHPDALPLVIANACYTSKFHRGESFAETWLKHPQGAIFYWGSMDVTYWDPDDVLERSMYEAIFKEKVATFSEMTRYALERVWAHYGGRSYSRHYMETYVSMGDPTLELFLVPSARGNDASISMK